MSIKSQLEAGVTHAFGSSRGLEGRPCLCEPSPAALREATLTPMALETAVEKHSV